MSDKNFILLCIIVVLISTLGTIYLSSGERRDDGKGKQVSAAFA